MRRRLSAVAVVLGLVAAVLPAPALARGVPRTLASTRDLGALTGVSAPVDTTFSMDYLGVSWLSGEKPSVRFLVEGRWSRWQEAHEDDVPVVDGRTFSHLIAADKADAYQLKGDAAGVRAVAINTTDGPRPLEWERPAAAASHLDQPPLLSRADWGADESLRFNADGTEKWAPAFYTTQKLVVHHTATKNDDPDPAATVRAIYRYHAIDKGWGDIGYNFLVDEQGTIYKGRYSGPAGTVDQDTLTGENAEGLGVTAAHVGGYNSGTMGIAVLGTYRGAKQLPSEARVSIVDHLAWESERHQLDPLATSTYVNPVNGSVKEAMPNISGHRDWASTQCPGDNFYAEIPPIREEVAIELASGGSTDTTAPAAPTNLAGVAGDARVALDWDDNTEVDLADYNVYRSTEAPELAERTWMRLDDGASATSAFTDTAVVNGTTYYYVVTALDSSGNESALSNEAAATPAASAAQGISLSADPYKVKGKQKVDLSWSGTTSSLVDIFRDGQLLITTANDGSYLDDINKTGNGSYTYKVCEAGTSTCSNEATATFS